MHEDMRRPDMHKKKRDTHLGAQHLSKVAKQAVLALCSSFQIRPGPLTQPSGG
jgi:hypothetical protein